MPMKSRRSGSRAIRFFSLLEVMIAISILAIGAGALFFRIGRLIDQKQFETESSRLKNLLLSSRLLALNTQTDWRLAFKKSAKGWVIKLHCLEDADLIYPAVSLSNNEILLNQRPLDKFSLDFFSTGLTRPSGTLTLQKKASYRIYQTNYQLPELFGVQENGKIAPFHPKDA